MYVKAIMAVIAIAALTIALFPTAFAINFAPKPPPPKIVNLFYCENTMPVGGNGTTYKLGICNNQEKSFQQKKCTVSNKSLTTSKFAINLDCPTQVYQLYKQQNP
jgi:hypothetical protein